MSEVHTSCKRKLPQTITQTQDRERASAHVRINASPDGIFNYASALLNDGLLYLEFRDAVREGDGERVIQCWKILMLYFFSAKHYNYTKEAVYLLAHVHAAATPKVAAQMKWSRFVNTRGKKGYNIPIDLYNEHLNRSLKDAVAAVGANASIQTILQCGKSLKGLIDTQNPFDSEHHIHKFSLEHSPAVSSKDENLIIDELITARVFDHVPGRFHPTFHNIKPCISMSMNVDKLIEMIRRHQRVLHTSALVAKQYQHKV